MNFKKLRLLAVLALICAASFVTFLQVKANQETDDPVSPSAVWTPENEDLSEIQQSCSTEVNYGKCFVARMEILASSEAVSFSKSLLEHQPSRTGYLEELREAGSVDLGTVVYSRDGTLSEEWVLLNGTPAIVNVDDFNLLPQSAMQKDPRFIALRRNYPQVGLSAETDHRTRLAAPEIAGLSDGGQRFIISYSLKEPCASCQTITHASFGFDFDAAGKFQGAKFLQIAP
ncbi:MAG TPA: hypothetical protein VE133_05970 [Candidatus Sulfotelmatobacter sp.]|nr:hypothetical protein [Candidatus Sulfotelmatobacter sp.]